MRSPALVHAQRLHGLRSRGHSKAVVACGGAMNESRDARAFSSPRKLQADPEDIQLQALLPDAHCHPQLDLDNLTAVNELESPCLAAMAVAADVDWQRVAHLTQIAKGRVIPAFGIHPWWSHLHASSLGASLPDILECSGSEGLESALCALREAACRGSTPPLRVVPTQEWRSRLRELLTAHPQAVVGEIGLDRAASIPGSKARTKFQHQLQLVEWQVDLAAELHRPVSIHCVRAYGHLLDLLARRTPDKCPPKIMLHSYSGSAEEVPRFTRLPGIGDRFYFSFSAAICARTAWQKVEARIRAVPDQRLLLESDQVSALEVDSTLLASVQMLASAKGWNLAQAAHITASNFHTFYREQLNMMAAAGAAPRGTFMSTTNQSS